jgi:hypothetical protein
MSLDELIARFDVADPAFIADPYPVLASCARPRRSLNEAAGH